MGQARVALTVASPLGCRIPADSPGEWAAPIPPFSEHTIRRVVGRASDSGCTRPPAWGPSPETYGRERRGPVAGVGHAGAFPGCLHHRDASERERPLALTRQALHTCATPAGSPGQTPGLLGLSRLESDLPQENDKGAYFRQLNALEAAGANALQVRPETTIFVHAAVRLRDWRTNAKNPRKHLDELVGGRSRPRRTPEAGGRAGRSGPRDGRGCARGHETGQQGSGQARGAQMPPQPLRARSRAMRDASGTRLPANNGPRRPGGFNREICSAAAGQAYRTRPPADAGAEVGGPDPGRRCDARACGRAAQAAGRRQAGRDRRGHPGAVPSPAFCPRNSWSRPTQYSATRGAGGWSAARYGCGRRRPGKARGAGR